MKKCYIALLSAVALLASCQAETDLNPSTELDQNVETEETALTVLTAAAQATTRIGYDDAEGTIAITWENNSDHVDSFTLYDANGDRLGDFTYAGEDGVKAGDFTSEVILTDSESYTAVIPATTAVTLAERAIEAADLSSQTIDDVEDIDYLNGAVTMSTTFEYSAEEDNTILFEHEVSLIKLNLMMNDSESPSQIVVEDSANGSTYTVSLPASCPSSITTYIAVTPREVAEAVDITFTVDDNDPVVITTSQDLVAGLFHEATISLVKDSVPGVNFDAATALWTKDYVNDFNIPAAGNATLAVMGDNLIVSTRSAQYIVDIASGSSLGEASWSMDLGTYGAITSDDGGNLLLFEGGTTSGAYTIYSTSSVDSAPTVLVSGTSPMTGYPFGKKISIYGDIDGDAVITAPMWFNMGGQSFACIRWIVTDGVIGAAAYVKQADGNSVVRPDENNGNMDICYASTDVTSGLYYTVAYSANVISAINAADNTYVGTVATILDTNYNLNCIDVIEYNSVKLIATFAGAHFAWGAPTAYIFDVTDPAYPTASSWSASISRISSGSAASGDIIMAADGGNLNLFFIDGLDGTIACYQIPSN